jgi:hypothetical protein
MIIRKLYVLSYKSATKNFAYFQNNPNRFECGKLALLRVYNIAVIMTNDQPSIKFSGPADWCLCSIITNSFCILVNAENGTAGIC